MQSVKSYHHGDLKPALLTAAEKILCRDGLSALTLRAVAREAGVSHGAPAHHFKDLAELVSELVASGFERLNTALQEAAATEPGFPPVAQAYLAFATDNPALFQLMFRVERLNAGNDRLRLARAAAFVTITGASGISPDITAADVTSAQIGALTAQWCFVQGFASLAANGRLAPLLNLAPQGTEPPDLLALALTQIHPIKQRILH